MKIVSPPRQGDHDKAVEWAREVLADPFTRILDTETTDLDGWVCELTMISRTGGTIVDTLLNPLAPISNEAWAVHGITQWEAEQSPTFKQFFSSMSAVFYTHRIICWNAPFDYGMVCKELDRAGLDTPSETNWQCAMRMYGQWKGELSSHGTYRWHKLEGGHRALGDCLTVVQRLNEMAIG